MNIIFEEKPYSTGEIKLELEPQDYIPSIQEKIKQASKHAKIPGFRPGKVPASLVQKMYGKSILLDEINKIISENVAKYLADKNIEILFDVHLDTDKSPSLSELYELSLGEPKPIYLYLNVILKPKPRIDLVEDLSGQEFIRYKVIPTEEEIEEYIRELSYKMGVYHQAESADINDTIYGTMSNGEKPDLETNMRIDLYKVPISIADRFVSKKVNDKIEIDLNTIKDILLKDAAFVVDDKNFNIKDKDAPQTFVYLIKNISHITPATIDETFYEQVSYGQVKEKNDFYGFIKDQLIKEFDHICKLDLCKKIEDKLLEKVEISLPENKIREKIINQNKNTPSDPQKQQNWLKEEIDSIKRRLIRERLLEMHNIEITREDILRQITLQIKQSWAKIMKQQNLDYLTINDIDLENEENQEFVEMAEKFIEKDEQRAVAYLKVEYHYMQQIFLEQVPHTVKEICISDYRTMKVT
ncbi:MAG: hypothetical protein NZ455_08205 [Bacteroidia bacterium]|nr:hypothetical protein [Bacteroidia bacterium]MDW8346339.1 trigger factor [Bacteroidia bacterium]